MTLPFKLVSGDSHVVEPHDLWTKRIDKRFRDQAPYLEVREEGDVLICPGSAAGDVITLGMMATKAKYDDPLLTFGNDHGRWEQIVEGGYNPDERIKTMDREGIEAQMTYCSVGLVMYQFPDREYRYAAFRAFNDWLAQEYCAASPNRLFGVAMLPTDDVERDVKELERCAKMGLRGAMIAVSLDKGESYNDPKFERLWAAAADLQMPLSLHVGASEEHFYYTGNKFTDFSLCYTPVMYTVVGMIFEGVLDRHPGMKILSVENDAAWAVGCLERMDNRWRMDQKWAGSHGLISGRKPSEIFHDQVGISFMFDRSAILCRDIIGKTNLMYGDDYPHHDGTWPLTAETLERQLEGVPLEDQVRIGRTNTIDFYKLPIETHVPGLETATA